MSRRCVNISIIEAEAPYRKCELCGKQAETRPYGPNSEEICYECGMKDKKTTNKMLGIFLFGDKP